MIDNINGIESWFDLEFDDVEVDLCYIMGVKLYFYLFVLGIFWRMGGVNVGWIIEVGKIDFDVKNEIVYDLSCLIKNVLRDVIEFYYLYLVKIFMD